MSNIDYSPYEIIKGVELEAVEPAARIRIQKEDVKKFFKDGLYGKVQDAVIQALFFYPYLTKFNISRYVDYKLKDLKWNDYSNLLKKMWQDGVVERLQYSKLNLYKLSDGTRTYATEKFKNLKTREIVLPDVNAAAVLESASLAQWHISLLCGEKATRSRFHEKLYIGEMPLYIPSYIELKKNGYKYHISSFCMPKDETGTENFILDIKAINHALKGKIKTTRKDIYINVIVSTTLTQIENTAAMLHSLEGTKDIAFYYVLNENTVLTKGLDLLYWYTTDDEDSKIKTISVKEK